MGRVVNYLRDYVKEGEFELKSGQVSDYYIDVKSAMLNPKFLNLLCSMTRGQHYNFNKILCMETGGIPFAVALSLDFNKRYSILRKEDKSHGISNRLIGDIGELDKVLIVDDVLTTGETVYELIKLVENRDAMVSGILCIVNRPNISRIAGYDVQSLALGYEFVTRD